MQTYEVRTTDGREVALAMQELWLSGDVLPVGARLVARHVFESAEEDPLEVVYSFMLPRDAALRSFRIEGDGFSVHSELQPVKKAEKAYEEALSDGTLASMTRNYRDGVTNLMVGNLQPGKRVTVYLEIIAGVEPRDGGYRFRFPFTLAPSYHPRACNVVTGPGQGEMELPEDTFGDVLLPPYHADAANLHRVGFRLSVKAPGGIEAVNSPSHTLRVGFGETDTCGVELSREADVPNRDLILDVSLKRRAPLVYAGSMPGLKMAVAAILPSTVFGEVSKKPGRTVFVVDRSGSMNGTPIAQAKKALRACLGALSPQDHFNIIAFDNTVDLMNRSLVHGDDHGRKEAEAFLDEVDARGGTELNGAISAAAALLNKGGGDLFVITDGQVFGTEAILNEVRALGLRVHVLGIGSASQDRFLSQLARQTGGTSRFVSPSERVDRAAMEVFSSISSPVAEELRVAIEGKDGVVLPAPNSTVFAGTPVVLYGEAANAEAISLEWVQDGVRRTLRLDQVPDMPDLAETLRLVRGARLITDLEAQMAVPGGRPAARREGKRMEMKLEALSEEYGLASRVMSLVAVVESERDTSGKLARTRVVPVGMPEGVPFEAYFATRPGDLSAVRKCCAAPIDDEACRMVAPSRMRSPSHMTRRRPSPPLEAMDALRVRPQEMEGEDLLIELAALVEADGGMPGNRPDRRVAASLLALLCFVAGGNTSEGGVYRRHVKRLVSFLRAAKPVRGGPDPVEPTIDMILAHGTSYGDWQDEARGWLKKPDAYSMEDWAETYVKLLEAVSTRGEGTRGEG